MTKITNISVLGHKSLLTISIVLVLASSFTITQFQGTRVRADTGGGSVVGSWFINAVGAPFQPHVANFHPDQTMEIDNPEAGDPHTSDSMGMGPWAIDQNGNGNTINGKFVEINADRTTNQYVSKLIVTYSVKVNGDTFTGPAQATYYNPDGSVQQGPFPATLNGTRISLP